MNKADLERLTSLDQNQTQAGQKNRHERGRAWENNP